MDKSIPLPAESVIPGCMRPTKDAASVSFNRVYLLRPGRMLKPVMFLMLALLTLTVGGQSTVTSAISGNWNDGSTWTGGVVPGPTDNVVISTLTTVTLTGLATGYTVNDFTIMAGGVLNAENKSFTVNGTLTVDGTYTSKNAAAKDLEFFGTTLRGTGYIKLDYADMSLNFRANCAIAQNSELLVYGNVRIYNNVTVTNNGRIEVAGDITGNGSSAVWLNGENSVLTAGGSLLQTGVLNASAPGNTVEYHGLSNQNIKVPSASYHNIVLRGAGNKNLQAATIIEGRVEIRSTAILVSNNHTLDVRGDWYDFGDFNEGTGEVIFSGNRVQILNSLNDEVFNRLKIDKTGGEVLLKSNLVVSNMLTMTKGVINSGDFKTTLGTSTSSVGTLTWLNGYVKGKYEKWMNNTGSIRLPVGHTSVHYMLLDVAAFTSGGSVIAEFVPSDPGNAGFPLTDGTATLRNTFVEGYWTLEPANGLTITGADNFNLRLLGTGFTSFPLGAETRIVTRSSESSPWTINGNHAPGTQYISARTGIKAMPAQFALADNSVCTRPVTSPVTGPDQVCTGDSPATYSVVDSGNPFTWSVNGGTIISGNGTNTISVTWGSEGTTGGLVSVYETSCTRSVAVSLPVTIHTVVPPTVAGPLTVPENTEGVVYSVDPMPGYEYQWNITGGTQTAGGNTNSITVNWGPAGQGTVAVITEFPGCSLAPEVKINVRKYDVIESIRSGDWNDEATWDCNCVPLPTQSVRIRNGHNVRLVPDGNQSVNNLIIDIGGLFNSNNNAFAVHGDFVVNGTYSGSAGAALHLDGTDKLLDGVGTVTGGFRVTGSKTISTTAILSITGDINLGSSVFVTNNGIIKLEGGIISPDASSTWMNTINSVLECSGPLLPNGNLRASAAGNRISYTGAAQVIKTPVNSIYHDLVINGTGTKTLSGSLTVEGDFTLSGSTLDITTVNYQINLKGDWLNMGGTLNPRGGTVTFSGEGEQKITGAVNFYNLTYTNDKGNLIISSNVTAAGVLTMSGLDIITGTSILKVGSDASNAGSLVHESGMVIGRLERWVNAAGPLLFPVGVPGYYNPAVITVNTVTTGSLIGEFIKADPGFSGLPLTEGGTDILYQFTDGYWNFVPQNGFAPPSYSVSLNASGFTSHSLNLNTRVLKRNVGSQWSLDGTHKSASLPNINRELLTGGLAAAGTQFGVGFVCELVNIDALITHSTCFDGQNGAIDISVSGGVAPYTYVWIPGNLTTQDITNLRAGVYGVRITDGEQCVTPAIFNVFEPLEMELTEVVTDVTCGAPSNGAINITAYGGTAPYLYGWTTVGGSGLDYDSEDQTGLSEGTYHVLVLDLNGCSIEKDIVVKAAAGPPPAPTASVTVQPDCSVSRGTISITAPLGEFEYSIDGSTFQSSPLFADLLPGNYSVVARSSVDITCVSPPTPLTVRAVPVPPAAPSVSVTAQPSCGTPTGVITITSPAGDNWEYRLDSGTWQLSPSFSGAEPGLHTITLRNNLEPTCISAPASVTVNPVPPPLPVPVAATVVQPTCGSPLGSINIVSQPGVEYSIGTGYQPGTLFSGLLPGSYTLSVRSTADNSCVAFSSGPVVIDPEPSAPDVPAALITIQPTCGTPFATLTITEPLGPQYEYNIDGGAFQVSPVFINVAPGNHILRARVIASPTCVSAPSQPYSITAPLAPVQPVAAVTSQPTCAVPTGTITFTAQDNVEYSIGAAYQASPVFSGVAPGVYTLSVRSVSDNDCISFAASQATINAVPSAPAKPVITVVTQPTCAIPSGSIRVTSPAGSQYEYSLDGGTYQAGAVFNGLAPGQHSVTARLAASVTCISPASEPVTINIVPSAPSVTFVKTDIVCRGASTGSINITVSGGTSPFTFAWTGTGVAAGSEDQAGLSAGTYVVTVSDANSCQSSPLSISITEPATSLTGTIVSQSNVSVNGGNDGSFEVSATGGTEPYTYRMNSGSFQPSGVYSGLVAGTYNITVRDANLCLANLQVTISQPAQLSGSVTDQQNIDCFGAATGSLTANASGGVSPYEYSLNGGAWQSSGTFSALPAGSYNISIRDASSSTFNLEATFFSPSEAVGGVITSQTDALCSSTASGSVTVAGSGGVAPYTYSLDGGAFQPDPVFSVTAGSHTVTVRDTKLCTFQVNVSITGPSIPLTGSITAIAGPECNGGPDGSVTAEGSGTGAVQFSLDGGAYQSSGTFTGLRGGSHTITIRDENLCTLQLPFTVDEPDAIEILEIHTDALCPDDPGGSINLTVSGGTAPYYVLWSEGYSGTVRENLREGQYSAVVTDDNGCAASIIVTIGVTGTDLCLVIPEIITPNDDGYNDLWRIRNIELFPDAEVMIFNRAGQRVFRAKNLLANPWDGKLGGKLLPVDSYHYILDLHDGSKPRSGVISIIR